MIYGSVCSGIEAATVAWHPLGWSPAWFAEIDKFPAAVLQHHYPDVPNLGDMSLIREKDEAQAIDLLVGGTPCQSFSVAGLRKGLGDDRGNLALEFCRLAAHSRPRWVVWENVPGVLSSHGGRDFASIVGALVELGYGLAWRVLDAQYFGVPQRRRRVFLVGHLGDWRPAGAVLFEREGLRGNPPPSREARKEVAGGVGGRASHWGGGPHPSLNQSNNTGGIGLSNQELFCQGGGGLVPDVAYAISCGSGGSKFGSGRHNQDTLIATPAIGFNWQNGGGYGKAHDGLGITEEGVAPLGRSQVPAVATPAVNASETPVHASETSLPLGAQDTGHAVAFQQNYVASSHAVAFDLNQVTNKENRSVPTPELCHTVPGTTRPPHLAQPSVRRLTPVECERLQGFPDDYTAIPWRGKAPEDCPDGHRYKALGNSMAVPVMRWIGQRIQQYEENK